MFMQLVGFIGLGNMGAPMANNLINKGYPLVVYDLMKPAVDSAVAAGAIKADSPSQVSVITFNRAVLVLGCVTGTEK